MAPGSIRARKLSDAGRNGVVDAINKHDSYDQETEERGLLLGDSTVGIVQSRLYTMLNSANGEVSGQFSRLSQIGIRVGSGAKLQFDEARFRTALEADRDAVANLLALRETAEDEDGSLEVVARGTMVQFDDLIESLTSSTDGLITRRTDTIDDQIELNNERIEFFDAKLEAKRQILEAQFQAMERTLAQLQDQSNALSSFNFAALTPSTGPSQQ